MFHDAMFGANYAILIRAEKQLMKLNAHHLCFTSAKQFGCSFVPGTNPSGLIHSECRVTGPLNHHEKLLRASSLMATLCCPIN